MDELLAYKMKYIVEAARGFHVDARRDTAGRRMDLHDRVIELVKETGVPYHDVMRKLRAEGVW